MKRLSLPLILALCVRGEIANAESTDNVSGNPGVDKGASDGQPTSSPSDPPPGESSLAHDQRIPLEPRGELVRLSRLPEAELLVNVSLASNDERSYFEVVSEKNGASLLVCGSPCRFRIWPGRYRVITNGSSGYIGGANSVMIESNSDVSINQPTVYRPALGAIVGAVGVASAIVGGILLATYHCSSECDDTSVAHNRAGFAALGAGFVVAPIGWILFWQSRNPEATVAPSPSESGS